MPHFHLSVQSGDDLILKRMKRRHCREEIFTFVKTVRAARPDAVFGGDFIAGFPTESDAAFSRSVSLVEELKLTWLHVFPYSERPGTPAAKMPQLSIEIRKSRAAKLRAIGDACVEQFLDEQIGSTTEVLIEKNGRGRSPQFAWVDVEGDLQNGQLISATIIGRDKETLIARKAE
jgi:threonylcarbamoyladenosine tRNA methylthiotransferase MtaB